MESSFFSSIQFKFMFFVTLCVSTSLLLCGGYFYSKISNVFTQFQVDQLSFEARIVSAPFVLAFKEMKSDLSVLVGTPPIQGIVRSARNGGVDPVDGSTFEVWRTRLATIFSSTILNRPDYVQVRYIGIADGGREIVRVNKVNGKPDVVEQEDLQQKGEEFYFKEGLTLAKNQAYFSAVSLNREHGKIQTPFLPVIRGIFPVHDDNGELFGMLVINAPYESIFRSVAAGMDVDKDLYIINEAGDYIHYEKNKQGKVTFVFRSLEQQNGSDTFSVEKILSSAKDKGTLFERLNNQDVVVEYYRDNRVFGDPNRFLIFAVVSPRDLFMAPIEDAQAEVLLIMAVSVFVCIAVALLFSSSIINPLVLMSKKIREYDESDGEELTGLPVHLKSEIGVLARSFNELLQKITIVRKDEQAALLLLEESEKQFRDAMEYSSAGMALVLPDGKWLAVNEALCSMLGYTEGELLDMDFYSITYPEDLEIDTKDVQQLLDGEIASYRVEKRYVGKEGECIWGMLSVSLVKDPHGQPKHFIVQIMDISDIKKTQQKLQEVNTELEEFTYRTSHDLRSPLMSSIGLLNVMEESLDDGDEKKARKSARLALKALTKLESLLQDILELGRLKNAEEEERDVSVKGLVSDSLEKFAHMENFNRLDIQVDLQHAHNVYTKVTRLRMIVENLISNAIKYQDVAKEKSFVRINAEESGGKLIFSVEDNGLGIPEEQRDNMFIMFKRFHPKTSFGSGLGMYMMKKSAEVIGARIQYTDTGEGSRFELVVPMKKKVKVKDCLKVETSNAA